MKQPKQFAQQAAKRVAQMTLLEKTSLMSGSSFWHLQPIERLDLPRIMVADGRMACANKPNTLIIWECRRPCLRLVFRRL
jgi:hypothetical protein